MLGTSEGYRMRRLVAKMCLEKGRATYETALLLLVDEPVKESRALRRILSRASCSLKLHVTIGKTVSFFTFGVLHSTYSLADT
jgi:hypothetical protein